MNFGFWLGIPNFDWISNFDFKFRILILNFKLKVVWLPGRSIRLSTKNFVCCNRNAILACCIGLYIIFFITQIHRVRFVSVNGRASRVKPSKNKFWKWVRKKFVEKKFGKKNVEKKCWINVLIKKILDK